MSCRTFNEELPGYTNGKLAAAERAAVETHLRGCHSCQTEVRALERLDRLLRDGLPWVEPSADLQRRFMARLAAEIESESTAEGNREGLFSWILRPWMIPAVASAALAVIVLVGSFGSRGEQAPQVAREPAAPIAPVAAVAKRENPVATAQDPAPEPRSILASSSRDPRGPNVPPALEQDPELFVDFAIIRELEFLQKVDGSSRGSAG